MHIAILGSTSQIAKDLIMSFAAEGQHTLALFARRPQVSRAWLTSVNIALDCSVAHLGEFSNAQHFDAIINFVGSGDPAQTAALGSAIFDITYQYDQLALDYLARHPGCRYIFLSSGAAYGSSFQQPVDESSVATVPINNLKPQDWYAVAKLYAECRHRALPNSHIVDVRVFNYFSHTLDLSTRFLIAEILRAIETGEQLITSPDNIVRDYIGPADFHLLISKILRGPPDNRAVDCFTLAPVDKFSLLSHMEASFGLRYVISQRPAGINATGVKMNYFSKNTNAKLFDYCPNLTSLESIHNETEFLLRSRR